MSTTGKFKGLGICCEQGEGLRSMLAKNAYVVVTPVRNEEKYIEKTIKSMISQTVLPVEWIIVNDGSTDRTGGIIDKYSKEHNWIEAVHREDRGFRKAGGGVVEAFNQGYNSLKTYYWDFLVKLDGDLSFDDDYFEKCFGHFQEDPALGIGGGLVTNLVGGEFRANEKNPIFHVRGATKIYKRECWEAIGGLIKAPGWDTLDEVKANMLGWRTRSFPDLFVRHHRQTGAANGTWANWVKNGRANYICGYHPLFMAAKCMKRIFEEPYLIASIGLLYGFLTGYTRRVPQVSDQTLVKYLRKQQLKRLLGMKSIWR